MSEFTPSPIDPEKLITSLRDAISVFIQQSGQSVATSGKEIEEFIELIRPDIELQTLRAVTDPQIAVTNLNFLYGTVVAKAGRVSLKGIFTHKQAVAAIVVAVLRTAIAFA